MNRRYALIAAIAALAVVAGCGAKASTADAAKEEPVAESEAAEAKEGISLSAEALKTAGVETSPATRQLIQERLDVAGQVAVPSNARAVVTPPVPGRVIQLLASIGDSVRRGQPLAVIQSGDLAESTSAISEAQSQAAQAEATVRQQSASVDLARGRLRTAQVNLSRQQQFAKAGAFSQPSVTAARNELSEAQTEQASARSELAGAQTRLARAQRLSKEGLISGAEYDQARLDVQQAEIRVERSADRLRLAQQTFERESRIGSQDLLNAREIQAAEAEVRTAKLELDRARVDFQGAQSAREGAYRAIRNARQRAVAIRGGSGGGESTVTLTAPIAGVITERQATMGQAVERASNLFDIENLSTVWVTANVPEAQISRVGIGTPVTVTTNAFPGRSFGGTVQLVGTKLDPKTRSLPVQCRVANPGLLLRSELFARVLIGTGKALSALAIPENAVVLEGGVAAVFVEEGGKFERRTVKTGRSDGRLIEILEGLEPGDRVAVKGVFVLQSELKKGQLKGDED